MANTYDKRIILDGWRNAVVRLSGVLDTSDASLTPAVTLQDFQNNDVVAGKLKGLRVDHVAFAIGAGIELLLEWDDGVNNQQLAPIAGRGRFDAWADGGWLPDMTRAGYDGSINLKTSGYMTGKQNYTVTLAMVKMYG